MIEYLVIHRNSPYRMVAFKEYMNTHPDAKKPVASHRIHKNEAYLCLHYSGDYYIYRYETEIAIYYVLAGKHQDIDDLLFSCSTSDIDYEILCST